MVDRPKDRTRDGSQRWWIRQQGGDVRVISQMERPDDSVSTGHRAIRITGPFTSEDVARKRAEKMSNGVFAARGAN